MMGHARYPTAVGVLCPPRKQGPRTVQRSARDVAQWHAWCGTAPRTAPRRAFAQRFCCVLASLERHWMHFRLNGDASRTIIPQGAHSYGPQAQAYGSYHSSHSCP